MSLKYRTSAGTSASNFTDLVVKVGDTLPIGAIIGFDTTGTIPNGWEYYAENQIKKISPTTPANGNIENQYGTSQTNAYSEEYSNNTFASKNVENYSTTETKIGTWYNNKPLYRKVIALSNITSSTSNADFEDLSSLNIEEVAHLYGYYYAGGNKFSVPFQDSEQNYCVMFVSSANKLRGRIVNSSGSIYARVVVEYTKTTD